MCVLRVWWVHAETCNIIPIDCKKNNRGGQRQYLILLHSHLCITCSCYCYIAQNINHVIIIRYNTMCLPGVCSRRAILRYSHTHFFVRRHISYPKTTCTFQYHILSFTKKKKILPWKYINSPFDIFATHSTHNVRYTRQTIPSNHKKLISNNTITVRP